MAVAILAARRAQIHGRQPGAVTLARLGHINCRTIGTCNAKALSQPLSLVQ